MPSSWKIPTTTVFITVKCVTNTAAATTNTRNETARRRVDAPLDPGNRQLSALAADGQQRHPEGRAEVPFQAEDWNQKIVQSSLKPRNCLPSQEPAAQEPPGHSDKVDVSGLLHQEPGSAQLRAQLITLISPEVADRLVDRSVEHSHRRNNEQDSSMRRQSVVKASQNRLIVLDVLQHV